MRRRFGETYVVLAFETSFESCRYIVRLELTGTNLKDLSTAKAKKLTEKTEEDLKAKVKDKRAKDISAAGKKGKKDLSTAKAM
jgi:hypothetical protein